MDASFLNVIIGLIFVFLLYSLLVTILNEIIAATFDLRAKQLEKAVRRMLDDGIEYPKNVFELVGAHRRETFKKLRSVLSYFKLCKAPERPCCLSSDFYDHPGIKYLGQNLLSNKPAYISPGFFAKALIDIIREKAGDQSGSAKTDPARVIREGIGKMKSADSKNETVHFLENLLCEADEDLEKFRNNLQLWYSETMDRTSGWYKSKAQKITFFLGLVVAITFNVDTIGIVHYLSKNPKQAELLADRAQAYAQTHDVNQIVHRDSLNKLEEKYQAELNTEITQTNTILGLGWQYTKAEVTYWDKAKFIGNHIINGWRHILGYLLTALAISFGAPFWFDLLNKFIQLRGAAGKKPDDPRKLPASETQKIETVG